MLISHEFVDNSRLCLLKKQIVKYIIHKNSDFVRDENYKDILV